MPQRLFAFRVTAPPSTPETSLAKEPMKLPKGTITKIQVLIPSGHAALAHLAIVHGETQIIPWGDQQWIEGDNESISWEPNYDLTSERNTLEARAWNEDDSNPHTFYVRVFVEPPERRPNWAVLEEGARAMSKFVKRVMGE